jgi:hypothetical protein
MFKLIEDFLLWTSDLTIRKGDFSFIFEATAVNIKELSFNNITISGITIVDTPGILSGEKQRVDRGYDFIGVLVSLISLKEIVFDVLSNMENNRNNPLTHPQANKQ